MTITYEKLKVKDIVLGIATLVGITIGSILITFYGYSRILETFKEHLPGYISVTNIVTLFESIHHLFTTMPELAYFILIQGLGLALGIIVSIANNY
ncbi:hypothetical protein ACTJ5T_09615 [Streptococcus suis]|uniref:Uncharacterized protein n=1 Tax=Streptococcus suis TaxID=1307 RepID=A0A123TH62_STRSU|nr:hypothetical protein [Streptococcus suis]CYV28520.1 Uncharacterised protein [Streptococcus suis]